MPVLPNFVGGSYKGFTANSALDDTINLIPELIESGTGKNKAVLAGTPGLAVLGTLPYYPIRGIWGGAQRTFAVAVNPADTAHSALFEILADGTYINRSVHGGSGGLHFTGTGMSSGLFQSWQDATSSIGGWSSTWDPAGGVMDDDGTPVTFAPNGLQLLIVSGGKVYCDSGNGPVACNFTVRFQDLVIDAADNTKITNDTGTLPVDATDVGKTFVITMDSPAGWTAGVYTITAVTAGVSATLNSAVGTVGTTGGLGYEIFGAVTATSCAFLDGYFVISGKTVSGDQPKGPKQVNVSEIYDGRFWPPDAYEVKSAYPDNVASVTADHEDLWVWGETQSAEIWRMKSPGDPTIGDFPFERDPGAIITQAAVAHSPAAVSIANGVAWIGGNTNGWPICWLTRGYVPMRISTHAVEREWASYSTFYDAVAFTLQDEGHSELWISFPSGNATWVYDANTQLWHRRAYGASFDRHRAQYHTYEWSKHLVSDYSNGKIYVLSHSAYDDDGTAIYFRRTAPHICEEMGRQFYDRFRLDHEYNSSVTMTLAWTDDSGAHWTSEFAPDGVVVAKGEPTYIVSSEWRRLGSARDRVFRLTGSGGGRRALVQVYINPAD